MTLKLIVEKLARSSKKFIASTELREECKKLSADYYSTICYLTRHKYVLRIFKGIFYIYSLEERKMGRLEMTFFEILTEALKLKGVTRWYFGLETALKFNNLTHEFFTIDYVISDKLFRAKPMLMMGRKVKFYKLIPRIISAGVIKDYFNYSDPEKTLLDLLYLKHYRRPEFEEMAEKLSKTKLFKYARNYNKRMTSVVRKLKC